MSNNDWHCSDLDCQNNDNYVCTVDNCQMNEDYETTKRKLKNN